MIILSLVFSYIFSVYFLKVSAYLSIYTCVSVSVCQTNEDHTLLDCQFWLFHAVLSSWLFLYVFLSFHVVLPLALHVSLRLAFHNQGYPAFLLSSHVCDVTPNFLPLPLHVRGPAIMCIHHSFILFIYAFINISFESVIRQISISIHLFSSFFAYPSVFVCAVLSASVLVISISVLPSRAH